MTFKLSIPNFFIKQSMQCDFPAERYC